MIKTIWKFEFNVTDIGHVMMPKGAVVISVGNQTPRRICLWAICDPEAEKEMRHFRVYGTGNSFDDRYTKDDYLGTVKDGQFVWHIFEKK